MKLSGFKILFVFVNICFVQAVTALAVTKQQTASTLPVTANVRHVSVTLNNEFSEINMSVARNIMITVQELVRAEEPIFLSKGLQKIVVRPLVAQENFVELLGYNQRNRLIGSFLLREKFALNTQSVRYALSNMCWPRENLRKQNLGRLVLAQSEAADARAYLNGFPLMNSATASDVIFALDVPVGADSDRNVLMITGPNRPVVGRVLGKSMLFKTHKWAIPRGRFAHR